MNALELQKVGIAYGTTTVLNQIDLTLRSAEMLYLVGKSGEGKSTLIKALIGEIPLTGLKAEVQGVDLLTLERSQRAGFRRRLGVIFQDFQLLSDRTVEGNLDFVLTATGWKEGGAKAQRIEEVLTQVGLEGKQKEWPHRLSGGEQQRLSVGRALLNKPGLLLADEPTGQLDPDSSEEILGLLVEINQRGTALIMSTHDYLTIDRFPARVVRCAGGGLTDLGGILFDAGGQGQNQNSRTSEAEHAPDLSPDITPGN
ncbi:MAG: cell division ATP-binding protein FtsE [Bacteroidota bacterium]